MRESALHEKEEKEKVLEQGTNEHEEGEDSENEVDQPEEWQDEEEHDDGNDAIEMPASSQQPLMESKQLRDLVKQGNKFAVALESGYVPLLQIIWGTEQESGRIGPKGGTYKHFLEGGSYCLALTPSSILRGVIAGDIFETYLGNKDVDLVRIIQQHNRYGDNIPGFYRVSLVNSEGISPSSGQLLQVLDRIERYCDPQKYNSSNDIDFAYRMDTVRSNYWQRGWIQKGWRRYLEPEKKDLEEMELPEPSEGTERDRRPVPRKVESCREYVRIMRERLLKEPDMNKPLARPLSYTGWGKCPSNRINTHMRHGSSRIMSITDAAYQAAYPQSSVGLRSIVLSFVCEEEHAYFGEILWTCVGQTNLVGGGGFNVAPPGESNNSLGKMSAKDVNEVAKWIFRNTLMKANFAEQTALMKSRRGRGLFIDDWRQRRSIDDAIEVAKEELDELSKHLEHRKQVKASALAFAHQSLTELKDALGM